MLCVYSWQLKVHNSPTYNTVQKLYW